MYPTRSSSDLHVSVIFGEEYKSLSPLLLSCLYCPFISSQISQNIVPSTLFLDTLSLYPSLNMRDQVSHLHRIARKIIVLYTAVFSFLDSKQEDKVWNWIVGSILWLQSVFLKIEIFIVVTLGCDSLVDHYQHCKGICCFHAHFSTPKLETFGTCLYVTTHDIEKTMILFLLHIFHLKLCSF
jgi:hypothetical protein